MAVEFTNECALLGRVIYDDSCIAEVMNIVTADMFSSPLTKKIYEKCIELYTNNKAVDRITVTQHTVNNWHNKDEAERFIKELVDVHGFNANAKEYAELVRNQHTINGINKMLNETLAKYTLPAELVNAIQDGLYEIDAVKSIGEAKRIDNVLSELINETDDDKVLDTGYTDIDKILNGIRKKNMLLIAARPAVGKSALGAELALKAAESGIKTLIFSCEMSNIEIAKRYIARKAMIDLNSIINRKIDQSILENAINEIKDLPLYLYDKPRVTISDILRTMQIVRNVGMIVVDHMQIMESTGKSETRNQELSVISGNLKKIAREYNIPVIALSQLSRKKDECDEPNLSDLRDSGALEQDADKVIMMWNYEEKAENKPQKIGIKIAKNRMGSTGCVLLLFKGQYMQFVQTDEKYVSQKKHRRFTATDTDLPDGW